MTRYDVTAPVKGYNGDVGGVKFYKGCAVVDGDTHGAAVAYMRRRGYTLTPITESAPAPSEEQVSEATSEPQDSGSTGPECGCEHSPCEHQQRDNEFDPGEHSVADVNEYLSGVDLRERERVLQAEAEGKSRLTVLNGPHSDLSGLKPEDKEPTS